MIKCISTIKSIWLLSILVLLADTNEGAWAQTDPLCKRETPASTREAEGYAQQGTWSWHVSSACSIGMDPVVTIDFRVPTGICVKKFALRGTSNVLTYWGTGLGCREVQQVTVLASSLFCSERQATLLYVYDEIIPAKCLEYYTAEEQAVRRGNAAEAATKYRQRETIYKNCVIEKSKNVAEGALREVRQVCRTIANNPGIMDRWRWGE